jgi:uncharacterized membrane protein
MRSRAKSHLPHVLLTLLSIIQALALELFWSEVQTLEELFTASWLAVVTWIQVSATFLGILVIWVVYATTVMRFSWVPGISDSVVPFFVGLLQFILIESLGAVSAGSWFISLAVIFALMHGETYLIMRRARRDPDNDEFFRQINPATIRDLIAPTVMVLTLLGLGIYVLVIPDSPGASGFGFLASLLLLLWHMVFMGMFWKRTMGELERFNPPPDES